MGTDHLLLLVHFFFIMGISCTCEFYIWWPFGTKVISKLKSSGYLPNPTARQVKDFKSKKFTFSSNTCVIPAVLPAQFKVKQNFVLIRYNSLQLDKVTKWELSKGVHPSGRISTQLKVLWQNLDLQVRHHTPLCKVQKMCKWELLW